MTSLPARVSFPAVLLFLVPVSCGDADVDLYIALDEIHSSRLIARFEADTGLTVDAQYDTEQSKTVGLVSRIIEERANPRCDVFWNNELAQTVRLEQRGLLEAYHSPSADSIPERYKDPEGHWTGFAGRARILIVNTGILPDPEEWPSSVWDMIDPKWKGRCGVAKPVTGTTLTHFTALEQVLGEEEFQRLIDGMKDNDVAILASNGATMNEVANGRLAWAWTDTDDYHVALTKGHPVTCVFPDQGEGEIGTMLNPNSVAIIAGGPHPEGAKRFMDWVLSEEVAALLAAAKSAQIPLRPGVEGPPAESILDAGSFRHMEWDAEEVAAALEDSLQRFDRLF